MLVIIVKYALMTLVKIIVLLVKNA
jgi:hypothetical protein